MSDIADLVEYEQHIWTIGAVPKKCPHGVFLSMNHGSTKAPYCALCFPAGPPFKTRKNIVLPRSCGDPLEAPRLRANNTIRGECPACHSRIYIELKAGKRECADCGETYNG